MKNRKITISGTIALTILVSVFTTFMLMRKNSAPENPGSPETSETESTEEEPEETKTSAAPAEPSKIYETAAEDLTEAEKNTSSGNCTLKLGRLMLINPNFTVDDTFIATRRSELINIATTYGIYEGKDYNGAPLLDAEAAEHLNDMVNAYKAEYPGHTFTTRSCFRSIGMNCGRFCYATGTTDHHTGLTCDLVDDSYGETLDPELLSQHPDWQWLHANSYKFGFIDRFPENWVGGSLDEPANIDETGSTGLWETWHYRYVGIDAATEIATGKYNNGEYDSLEHYLLAKNYVNSLRPASCP